MKIGFLGFGKMGSRMVNKLLKEGHEVVGWNRSEEKISSFELGISNSNYSKNFSSKDTIERLIKELPNPRVVWLMLPAGEATESALSEISKYIEPEDIVIDGGNSNFQDTERRYKNFKEKNIRFLGIGVSGGVIAAENGYPLMVGGDRSAYDYVVLILDSLAKPNGDHDYFGLGGAGHFVKMVHNGIEYGMMQAVGEGFGVLEKSDYKFDLTKVAQNYTKGTIVSGFLMDRARDGLHKDPNLSEIDGVIGKASGEAIWTVDEAKRNDLPIGIIEESLEFRNRSESDPKIQKSFAAKVVAMLRHEFGGHEVKKK